MMTTQDEITAFRHDGTWKRLAEQARVMVQDAELAAGIPMQPRLGGGTRLMLALAHRISHDIDLFIRDPQWIGYLSPRLNDRYEHLISGYQEDSNSLKLRLDDGEIDFVVGMSLLGLPDEQIADVPFALEPVAEVLAKKLFYRGWALTPRDLFDWWVIEVRHPGRVDAASMGQLLTGDRQALLTSALDKMQVAPSSTLLWERIAAPDKPPLTEAIAWGRTQAINYSEAARDAAKTKHRPG